MDISTYPSIVAQCTVEDQLPLHTAAERFDVHIMKRVLDSATQGPTMKPYSIQPHTDNPITYHYLSNCDLNFLDQWGCTPLFYAVSRNNVEVLRFMLNYRVSVLDVEESSVVFEDNTAYYSKGKERQLFGTVMADTETESRLVCPFNVNLRAGNGATPLLEAIAKDQHEIAELLLQAGADYDLVKLVAVENYEEPTPLMWAALKMDYTMTSLLLRYGAKDEDNSVYCIANSKGCAEIVSTLLRHRARRDMTNKINRNAMVADHVFDGNYGIEGYNDFGNETQNLETESCSNNKKYPISPVIIDWSGYKTLQSVDEKCLFGAVLSLNPLLSHSSKFYVYAITNINVSNNSLQLLPAHLFCLPSLQVLDCSDNLVGEILEPTKTNCPMLNKVTLNKNRLATIPSFLFHLPSLTILGASNNHISCISPDIWRSPSLKTVDLSRNKLRDIPPPKNSPVYNTQLQRIVSRDDQASSDDNCRITAEINVNVMRVNYWSKNIKIIEKSYSCDQELGLTHLILSDNQFASLPEGLSCLAPNLRTLNMSRNQLESFGTPALYPSCLIDLDLSHNSELKLLDLTVGDNDDSSQTGSIRCYQQRTSSSAVGAGGARSRSHTSNSSNQTWSMPTIHECSHRQHTRFSHLTSLNLSYCSKLTLRCGPAVESRRQLISTDSSMPKPAMASEIQATLAFPVLQSLNLSHTNVSKVPREIGEMSNLMSLQLAHTKITKLPGEMGLLTKLDHLDLENCSLEGPIQAMVANKDQPRDIIGFLNSVREESVRYNCMNLMFVGAHMIGKTSLLQLLRKEGKTKHKNLHWAERVSDGFSTKKGELLSTVGIDINELVIDRRDKGPVVFRTWDFGGQKEYYATHQYFLSPRSLYLVMWKLTSGESGIRGVVEWLINIQARAPRSHVIIVGTHLDMLKTRPTRGDYPQDFEASMTQRLRDIICVIEPEKYGLPNVLKVLNVSCKTEENVKPLLDYIYDVVFKLPHPGSKHTLILNQKIPKKYLTLQKIIEEITIERKRDKKDPVLSKKLYSMVAMNKMIEKTNTVFRDLAELQQATNFLHENGVLFHFTDAHLKDIYFLDPQWLCDQLAKVVTIKDINCFAPNGVMEIAQLHHLFRGITSHPSSVMKYIVSLLERFEVALPFDDRNLIIPSMLPSERELPAFINMKCDARIPARKHSRDQVTVERFPIQGRVPSGTQPPVMLHAGNSTFFGGSAQRATANERMHLGYSLKTYNRKFVKIKHYSNSAMYSLTRLYLMTYFPSGFWPRLITRLLADSTFHDMTKRLYDPPSSYVAECSDFYAKFRSNPEWRCWRTGLELRFLGMPVLWVKEYDPDFPAALCDYAECELMCVQEGDWAPVDLVSSSIIEVHVPSTSIVFALQEHDDGSAASDANLHTITVHKKNKTSARLLAKIIEHVDVLLHDWFPDLGELRLAQNMDGRYLITRLVPCPKCIVGQKLRLTGGSKEWWDVLGQDDDKVFTSCSFNASRSGMVSRERKTSLLLQRRESDSMTPGADLVYDHEHRECCVKHIYTFMVEHCIILSKTNTHITCPLHGAISPHYVSDGCNIISSFHLVPEIIFQDLPENLVIPRDRLQIGAFLGRGSFGFVFAGDLVSVDTGTELVKPVALKLLEPIKSGFDVQSAVTRNYSDVKSNKTTLMMDHAVRGYLSARQEVSIHGNLSHGNVVELIGIVLSPLSLVLEIAPLGELSGILTKYHYNQCRLSVYSLTHTIRQVSSGLAYLHSQNIIYRDLKSENVLVWSFPSHIDPNAIHSVHVKISDYGISRAIMPSGTRGFGGSPPFMAPEIIHHGGKDTYTTKVDCFSFGMFLYELLTCQQPFADYPSPGNLNLLVYQGGRPHITSSITNYPSYILDLMTFCWSQEARNRPTSQEIHTLSTRPEFGHLLDAISMENDTLIMATGILHTELYTMGQDPDDQCETASSLSQVWVSPTSMQDLSHIHVYSYAGNKCIDKLVLSVPVTVLCLCDILGDMWCVDAANVLRIYSSISFKQVFELPIPETRSACKPVAMFYAAKLQKVAIVMDAGCIFVLGDSVMVAGDDIGFQFIPRGHSNAVCAGLLKTDDRVFEVWVGHTEGAITVRTLDDDLTLNTITHNNVLVSVTTQCSMLVTQDMPHPTVWSTVYPGSTVYRWDGRTKQVTCELDVSSVETHSLDDILHSPGSHDRLLTAMNVLGAYLYVGTSAGNILVTSATTLSPLAWLRCHSNEAYYIRDLIPLSTDNSCPVILSIGKGYRNLMNFNVFTDNSQTLSRHRDVTSSVNSQGDHDGPTHGHILAWLADGWEHY